MGAIIKWAKNRVVDSWPIKINGFSTGHLPIHVKISQLDIVNQKSSWVRG